MENIIYQNWNFCIDKEATNEYYKKNTQDQCNCIYCENYRKSVSKNIPEELKDFLNKFGIEIDNPEEIICLDVKDNIINYEVFYPVKGSVVLDEEKNIELEQAGCNIRVIPLEKGPNTQMTDSGFYFDILNVILPFKIKTEKDPFDTLENKERIKKSILQLESMGGTIHEIDLDK